MNLQNKEQTLNYQSLCGPENAVFYRGKNVGKTEIRLPDLWKDMVDLTTVSVHLTPIGAHQDIIVKRVGQNKVWLQTRSGIPIHCYFLVIAERIDFPQN